ncbi:MAG: transcriptional repressor [Clostridiales bacterium]|jgi:Fur family ferric uptake transcriptional regulator/Fur family peroxide stress response transcriptional regulator|nr:transcriptional repressor [Clostridiales bacterium]
MEHRRKTIQQQVILDAVRELNIHATAEEVYDRVAAKHPSISKATVYRNLSQMSEAGELVNIGSFFGSTHYDHNCHKHYHFICERCKRVFDVDDYFPDLTEQLSGMDGFEITGHQLTFSGLCHECKS